MRAIFLVTAFAVALTESAVADSVARGLGSQTCAQFAEQYRAAPEHADLAYMSWAQGFMSGWNFALIDSKNTYRNLDALTFDAQATHLRQFCNNHPLASFVQAVIDLFNSLPLKKMPQSN
jgi:hypothetical protein